MAEAKRYQHYELAELVLQSPSRFRWSLQGFGMLRFYITQELRLHIWDSAFRVGAVSGIHTHPWHFVSTVLCGRLTQYRYTEETNGGKAFKRYVIRAGEGGGLEGEPDHVLLAQSPLEVVHPGQQYCQRAEEIHLSVPDDGTMTIVHRELADPRFPDHAYVYVPADEEWVSAEPREATREEVEAICERALDRAFS